MSWRAGSYSRVRTLGTRKISRLIAGCGRVGAGLANALYKEGHDVSVVDRDPESFVLLEDAFTGFRQELYLCSRT